MQLSVVYLISLLQTCINNVIAQLRLLRLSSHHKHQDHGALVDIVCVYACSLPKPTPDIHEEKKGTLMNVYTKI